MRHLHTERGKSVEDPKFLFNRFFFHKKKEEEVIHFPSQSPIRIEALRKKKIFDFFLSDLSSIKRGINNNSSSRAAMECVCPLC